MKKKRGFTLIELLIALALIVALAAWIIPSCKNLLQRQKEQAIKQEETRQTWAKIPTYVGLDLPTWDWGDKKIKENLKVICIDGFEYYFSSVGQGTWEDVKESRAILAPKFDKDTAFPKRCIVEQEKP